MAIPWGIAFVIAPVVLVGGQVGAALNHRLPESIVLTMLVGTYLLVGVVTLVRLVS